MWQECAEEMPPLLDLAVSKASSRGKTAADSRYSRERLDLVVVNLAYCTEELYLVMPWGNYSIL